MLFTANGMLASPRALGQAHTRLLPGGGHLAAKQKKTTIGRRHRRRLFAQTSRYVASAYQCLLLRRKNQAMRDMWRWLIFCGGRVHGGRRPCGGKEIAAIAACAVLTLRLHCYRGILLARRLDCWVFSGETPPR